MTKGRDSQPAYFATIKKDEATKLQIKEKDALLLEILNKIFPTVIRKHGSSKGRQMLGFTVPCKIGKELSLKTDINFKFLKKNFIHKKELSKVKGNLNLQDIIPSKTIRDYSFYLFDLEKNFMIWIYSGGVKPYIL